ncbi:MAG TPA: aldehyde dehydrogenase family protein [Thermoleophilaceae bacterium]|nr:aldehyde dehydrogenase family protein [Thermoleophilaceae bacterium]
MPETAPSDAPLLGAYGERLGRAVHDFLEPRYLPLSIGGREVAVEGPAIPVEDPARGVVVAEVPAAGAREVDEAVEAARAAMSGAWRRLSAHQRSMTLHAVADLVEQHGETFAQLESLDSGKPVAAARDYDIPKTIEFFRYFAGWPTKIEGSTIPGPGEHRLIYTLRQPVGVVAQILPWNFPLMIAAWKLAPALAAGCTTVVKPAEQTPLSVLYLARLLREADLLPPGVVNVVTGHGAEAGAALASHEGVAKVSFTGSPEVAREIVRAAAGNLKRVTLELGGKSPNIVLPDMDPAEIAPEAAAAIFLNQGENCIAGSRLFVHRSIFDEVVAGVRDSADDVRLGPGLDEATTMGPLISAQHRDRVLEYVGAGAEAGGDVHRATAARDRPAGGYFVEPTVITGVSDDARVAREEIFGPVLVALPFESLEEVAARANSTEYGLAAGIWTHDVAAAHDLARMLEAGTVWINTYNETDPAVPFGGFKQSGWGREHGGEVLDQHLETKSVWVNLERRSRGQGELR